MSYLVKSSYFNNLFFSTFYLRASNFFMKHSVIAGIGMYVPEQIVTNDELSKYMDTNDTWIREHTGIEERRFADRTKETTASMGAEAAKVAIERAGISKDDIDFILFATLSPDYYFPGCGVLVQRALKLSNIGAMDIRTQCTGFLYALSTADQFIKSGMYKNILVIGAEKQSFGMDFSTRGRTLATLFGDGAAAAVLQPSEDENRGILSTHLHSDGNYAEMLGMFNPGSHGNYWVEKDLATFDLSGEYGGMLMTQEMLDTGEIYAFMNGQPVLRKGMIMLPEVIMEALNANDKKPEDLGMMIFHQSNLSLCQLVQQKLNLRDDQVFNNIQKYGNTTAASIPMALCEAWQNGLIKKGDLVCLAAFGSGFTWASVLLKW